MWTGLMFSQRESRYFFESLFHLSKGRWFDFDSLSPLICNGIHFEKYLPIVMALLMEIS